MRSKLPTVAIGRYDAVTFDLIRSGLSRTTFPSIDAPPYTGETRPRLFGVWNSVHQGMPLPLPSHIQAQFKGGVFSLFFQT